MFVFPSLSSCMFHSHFRWRCHSFHDTIHTIFTLDQPATHIPPVLCLPCLPNLLLIHDIKLVQRFGAKAPAYTQWLSLVGFIGLTRMWMVASNQSTLAAASNHLLYVVHAQQHSTTCLWKVVDLEMWCASERILLACL